MSIAVTTNNDGTITVTCGTESLIVRVPPPSTPGQSPENAGPGDPPGPASSDQSSGASEWPTLTPAPGGFNATFTVKREKAVQREANVQSLEDVIKAIDEALCTATVSEPISLTLRWRGDLVAINAGRIAAAMNAHDAWNKVFCTIYFDGNQSG